MKSKFPQHSFQRKVFSKKTLALILALSVIGQASFIFGFHKASAISDQNQTCVNGQVIVSGTDDSVNGGGKAVATYSGNPLWTASILGATWIWNTATVTDPTSQQVVNFSRTFTLTDQPASSTLQVAGDDLYTVSLNGHLIDMPNQQQNYTAEGQGSVTIDPSFFQTGSNEIDFTVTNLPSADATYLTNPAGLLYRLVVNMNGQCPADSGAGSGGNSTSTDATSTTSTSTNATSTNSTSTTTANTATSSNSDQQNNNTNASDNGPVRGISGIPGFLLQAPLNGGMVLGISTSTDPAEEMSSTTSEQLPAVVASGTCRYLVDYLQLGKNNDPQQVTLLQQFLNQSLGSNLAVNGVFDPQTFNAVEQFQLKYWQDVLLPWVPFGLPAPTIATGYVYKTTEREINMLECPNQKTPMPQLP